MLLFIHCKSNLADIYSFRSLKSCEINAPLTSVLILLVEVVFTHLERGIEIYGSMVLHSSSDFPEERVCCLSHSFILPPFLFNTKVRSAEITVLK